MGIKETFSILASAQTEFAIPALVAALSTGEDRVMAAAADALTDHPSHTGYMALVNHFDDLPRRAKDIIKQSTYRMHEVLLELIEHGSDHERERVLEIVSGNVAVESLDLQMHLLSFVSGEALTQLEDDIRENVLRFMQEREDAVEEAELNDRRLPERLNRDHKATLRAIQIGVESMQTHGSAVPLECALEAGEQGTSLIVQLVGAKSTLKSVRDHVIERLKNSDSPEVVACLFEMIDEESTRVRRIASEILEQKDSDKARELISRHLLKIDDKQLRHYIRSAHGLPWLPIFRNQTDLLTVRHIELFDDELRGLNIPDSDKQRYRVVLAASRVRQVARHNLDALGKSESQEVAQDLQDLMRDADEKTQLNVIDALQELKSPFLHRVLTPFIASEHEEVRTKATAAVAPGSFDRYLNQFDSMGDETKVIAGRAAIDLNHDEALVRLKRELRDASPKRRVRAIEIVHLCGMAHELTEYLVPLVSDGDRRVRAAVVEVLVDIRNAPALKALLKLLSDRDPRVQANAVEALDALDRPEFRRVLVPFLKSPNNRTRANACRALWKLGMRGEVENAMKDMLRSSKIKMRQSGAWVIAETRPTGAKAALESALKVEKSERVQLTLKHALAKLNGGGE